MKKVMILAALAAIVTFSSCNVNDDINDNQVNAVKFTAGIDRQAIADAGGGTRAAGTTWASGDAIGIFMVSTGGATVAESSSNMHYTTTGNGTFSAVTGSEIYFPMDGSAVDFISYYPYKVGAAFGTDTEVNVAGTQTAISQPGIDLLWAKANNNGNGYNKNSTGSVALSFDHKLSKLVMNCKADASVGTALTGMTVSINGMNTANTFDLATGKLGTPGTKATIIPQKITTADTYEASYDAIILPGTYVADVVKVEFVIGSETFIWKVPAVTFAAGNEYTYAITLSRTGVTFTASINPWGNGGSDTGTAE